MNEYLKAFQDINQSADKLLVDENNSPEIQQSAISLNKSIQPCIEEIKQSATKLKGLVDKCFYDLYHSDRPQLIKLPFTVLENSLLFPSCQKFP